ncbi:MULTISPECIES: FadR/GntR family transcriptional regulator [Marinovum]|jgi:GntR family transcriptional repressor for pyruvate dehydrogenase complex|uniref:DNA-binding transcriptional regulator, FadR family n=2 Tax=Marinovum algicola TaxID=42444 RepID=A0A975ZQJ4_9RHOB|nr:MULTISPECIES: FadR/GntR family transcriptional regulator [Marinovum]AKO99097.1 Transcriptional regulator [Marinovum algicola DG 898]MDD9740622.1 FadR/GntR family transcriptional regulator [Marinovum sp. SP66]MDD9746236.1 FadR/GntR family transcriptional regulator [Marinovum sp. PR37]SEK06659.1 DNA-binding transcriptional regulator, FadR family [Marinovum algicola]SLN76120.1 HTH-type transcriptional regulator LutR [Marinovum algicola]
MTEDPGTTKMPLRASRADLPTMLADALREQILSGELAAGDKLPTERAFCERYDVSRAVVREAVSRLRHEGLLSSRQGVGVFVSAPDKNRFLSITEEQMSQPEDFRHLYQVRNILESQTARLAAQFRSEQDLAKLRALIDDMESETASPESYIEADFGFHRALAAASQNPFLVLFISYIDQTLKNSIALAIDKQIFEETTKIAAQEHQVILDCVEAQDEQGACDAMTRHLVGSSERLGLAS